MSPLEEFLLKAYLDGELDDEAAEAFELLMIERPDIAEWADADSVLRIGLGQGESSSAATEQVVASVAAAVGTDGTENSNQAGRMVRGERFGRRRALAFSPALAAGLMLVVGLGTGYFAGKPTGEEMRPATLAYVDKARDISAKPRILLADAGAIVLLAPVATMDDCVPEVRLHQAGGNDLRASAVPDEFGYVSLVLSRDALHLGEAEVEVHCGAAPVSRYEVIFVSANAERTAR